MKEVNSDKVILIEERILIDCMEFIDNNSNSVYKTLNP